MITANMGAAIRKNMNFFIIIRTKNYYNSIPGDKMKPTESNMKKVNIFWQHKTFTRSNSMKAVLKTF